MSKKPRGSSPHLQWERLSNERRFQLAKSVIKRRGDKWRKQFKGLIAVGFGVRHQNKEKKDLLPPGLLFFVSRKRNNTKQLPKEVRVKVPTRKGSATVSIPSDVVESGKVELQAQFEARDRNGTALKIGSACCALASTSGGRASFILGCHHVFLASEDMVGLVPANVSYVSYGGARIGDVAAAGRMNPAANPATVSDDAALVYIEETARQTLGRYWSPWAPSNIARSASAIDVAGQYALYADNDFLTAAYIGWVPNWPVPVGSGQSILLPEALLYDTASLPGMSGAAFINTENGLILGMHTARMESPTVARGWVAVAQPMWHLASKDGPFGMDLYLGTI